jgi:dinuclear metal center YbgI/SA1388 family protein
MIDLQTLIDYNYTLLDVDAFRDYCPNGLQVESSRPIQRLMTGVTASLACIQAAIDRQADALLVHHGLFWDNQDNRLIGPRRQRIALLLEADIALLAYHLPLDMHPELGNNRQLAARLGIIDPQPTVAGNGFIWRGTLQPAQSGSEFAHHIEKQLQRAPLHIQVIKRPLKKVTWCTGSAQHYLEQAANLGSDAYLSGEISEQTTHLAREFGLDYFALGHHASERYGVQALGQRLAQQFDLHHEFIEIANPA